MTRIYLLILVKIFLMQPESILNIESWWRPIDENHSSSSKQRYSFGSGFREIVCVLRGLSEWSIRDKE
jgi:hypothetical protein